MSKDPIMTESDKQLRNGIRQDLEGIKYKMLNELFLQASNNNGVIDRNSPNFNTLRESFLNADPNDKKNEGKAVISVLGTEQTALKKLEKSGLLEVNPLLYAEIKAEINNVRVDLTKKLDSNQGVQDLLSDFLKQKSMEQMPFQVLITQKQGMYDVGDTRPMANAEVRAFTDKLMPHVDLSGANISALTTNGRVIDQGIGPIIQQAMINNFGKPLANNPNAYTLEESQVTPEKARAFGAEVSHQIKEYSQQQAKPYDLMKHAFDKAERDGVKFTIEQKNKIAKTLAPSLLALGTEHLEKSMDRLASEIATELKGSRSLISRVTGKSDISDSNLGKIAARIEKNETPKSIKVSAEQFDLKLGKSELKNTQFNANLKAYSQKYGIRDDLTKMDNTELAKVRLKNPKAFDAAVFAKETQVHTPKEVALSPKAIEVQAKLAQSKANPILRTDSPAKSSPSIDQPAAKIANLPAKIPSTAIARRPLPLTPSELEKSKAQQTDQKPLSPLKPGTIGQAGGQKISGMYEKPLKGSDARPIPTPPKPLVPGPRNKGRSDGGIGG